MINHLNKLHNPIYLFAFFILVAFLSSQLAWLQMEGMMTAVVIAGGVVLVTPLLLSGIKRSWKATLEGKPTKLDFVTAPSGYRRARLAETEEVAIAQSVVIPTPNRPLIAQERVAEISPAFHAAPTVAVPSELIKAHASGSRVVSTAVKSRAIEPVKVRNDPNNPILDLAPGCTPCIDDVLGRSICGLGIRGSGKTTLAARLIEQIGLLPNIVPMAIFDDAQDYASLPEVLERAVVAGSPSWTEQWRYQDYYWEVTEENAEEIGYLIFEDRIQLILQIHTYETLEIAARIMCRIIKGMFAWADEREPSQRVPCMVFLDEAQRYLPQDQSVSPIAKEETKALLKAFDALNSIGRKKGFTPAIFTQRPAQIQKPAIVGSEIYFLGLQTFPNDLDKYEDITGKDKLSRAVVQKFKPGEFALFESGEVSLIHAHERQSEHRGTTPGYAQAGKRDSVKSVTTQKIRSVQTTLLDEEIDTEPGYEDIEEDGYPFSSTTRDTDIYESKVNRQPETPKTLVPVMPDKEIRTDDIPTDTLVIIWNGLAHDNKTVDGLASSLSCNRNQSYKAYKRIQERFNAALEEEE